MGMASIVTPLQNGRMSSIVPTIEPNIITAGDTIQWSRSFPDYPSASGWVLKYALRGPSVIDITADASQQVIVLASTSSAWVAGVYSVQGYVVKGAEQHTIYSGTMIIRPNLINVSGIYDGRSHARRVLDAIEAVIEKRASKGDQQTTIDGIMLNKMTAEQLMMMRARYQRECAAEQRVTDRLDGKKSGRRVLMRFT
jgi:hypothetical protein